MVIISLTRKSCALFGGFYDFVIMQNVLHRMSDLLYSKELHKAEIVLLKLVQFDSFGDSPENKINFLEIVKESNSLLRIKAKIFTR